MADETTTETTQGQGQQGQQPAGASGGGVGGRTLTQDEVDRIIAERLSREREKYKDYADLKKAADELAQLKQGQLSDLEKRDRRIKELEEAAAAKDMTLKERTIRYEVMLAASRLGIVDPEAAYRLLDQSALKFDDDGAPTNTEAALRDLLKARPYLAGGTASGGATNPNRERPGLTLEDIKRMSPEEINSRWAEVEKALSGA